MGATAKQAKTTFKVGDKAVYPAHGVGVIEAIENKQIGGAKHKFYMLRILENDMTIMIPLGNVDAVGLRTVIDRKMVSRINRILREQDIRIDTQTWNRRYREYTEKIKTGSVLEIAEVLRDLCVLKRKKKELSFGERKMLDTARSLLVKEISIAKGMKEADVMTDLERVLGEGHVGDGNGNGNGKVNGRGAEGEGDATASAKAPAASARPPAAPKAAPAEPSKAAKAEPKAKAAAKPKAKAAPKEKAAPKAKAKAKAPAKAKAKVPAKAKAKAPAKPKAKVPAAKKAKAASGKGSAAAGAGTRAAAKKSSASTTKKAAKPAQSKARRKK